MLGLPGDYSPPSRFVKASVLLKTALQPNDATDAVNLATHIMNNFDIARGTVRAKSNGNESNEITQWTVFRDLTHKIFYYRTYSDLTLHSIDLSKIDFSANAARLKMPVADQQVVLDMTQRFLQQKS
jgi:choloylglycine hydrolase